MKCKQFKNKNHLRYAKGNTKCVTLGQEKLSLRNTACAELYLLLSLQTYSHALLSVCVCVCVSKQRLRFLKSRIRTRTPLCHI